MKKFLNSPDTIMDETIEGYVLANQKRLKLVEGTHQVLRRKPKEKGKVKLVIGNGGGHEPGTLGQIGYGMYDMVCLGDIFAAQSGQKFFEAIQALDDTSPILITISNHAGDVMNGNLAYKRAKEAGIDVAKVIFYDDVTSAPKEFEEDRRGMTGMLFSVKAAGAVAEDGGSLEECIRAFDKARENTRTISVALTTCTHPQTGMTMMEVPEEKVDIGAGVHGEGGALQIDFSSSYEIISQAMDLLVEDKPYVEGDEVLLLVNGMGSTTMMEQAIVYQDICRYLEKKGITVYDGAAGDMVTTQEMGGITISLCKVDEELKQWWNAPCSSPVYSNV